MKYVDEFDNSMINRWDMHDVPVRMRVWLVELEWTFETMMNKSWLPRECPCPQAKLIERLPKDAPDWMYYAN